MDRRAKETPPKQEVKPYDLSILPRAERALGKLSEDLRSKIAAAIDTLANEPRPHGSKKLAGREGWRVRVGDYRAIYEIDDQKRTAACHP